MKYREFTLRSSLKSHTKFLQRVQWVTGENFLPFLDRYASKVKGSTSVDDQERVCILLAKLRSSKLQCVSTLYISYTLKELREALRTWQHQKIVTTGENKSAERKMKRRED